MPDTHARFSPSAANRRIHCPPSLLLEEQFEEGESVYAAEGTAGHALAEHLIRKHLKQRTTRPTSEYYKDELLEAVDEYVSFVIGEIEDARRECHSPVLLVEQRIDASEYVDGCFGTADMVIITDKVAHVIDLKLGKGVEVHAEENPQLMIYGLGVLHMAEALYDIETVRMTIFQPRLGNSSTWSVSPEYLKRWGDEVLRPAGAQALIGAGDFSAGTWCRFCRARTQCRARAESYLALAKMDFRQPALLSDAEISEIIGKADELSKWAADVYAFAQDEAVNHGKAWPGFKVVEGRSIRLLKEHGVEVYFEEQNIYTLDSKGELLLTIMSSLAQEESRNISENVTWGQRKRFADGKVSMPYKHFLGYRKGENGEPEVVPEEAEIVRRIYGLFLKGQTPYGIKTIFEAEGIPTPAGKKTWQTATILSILTNEKYKGDALLQKTFCTDFLTKKMKVNEGEVPQYYVENSHPAIVTDEVFNMVQEEIERRRQAGRQHNGTSCFAGRIFCGCCGEMYGSKVWHSTDKYRRVIWQCNAKFKDGHHCGTPHLTEAEIQQRFLKAFNRLLDERTFILEDTAAIMEQLTATADLEAKVENLREEMDVVSELIRQAIEQNASMTMDQAEFEQRYQSLSERFQRAADHLKGIEAECARRAHKVSELEAFIKNLRGREMPIEEFDAMLWMSMVKRVMVEVDGSMRFTFANEMEVII